MGLTGDSLIIFRPKHTRLTLFCLILHIPVQYHPFGVFYPSNIYLFPHIFVSNHPYLHLTAEKLHHKTTSMNMVYFVGCCSLDHYCVFFSVNW